MTGGAALLDQAIGYAVGAVGHVTPALLTRPTPCRAWDLGRLLRHACESVTALQGGLLGGAVGLLPGSAEPVPAFHEGLDRLRAARAFAGGRDGPVDVAGLPLPAVMLECAAALEIAVHGWDISQACGTRTPLPDPLAAGLLAVAPLLVPETGRRPLFGPPVAADAHADPGERLVAFLGRTPAGH